MSLPSYRTIAKTSFLITDILNEPHDGKGGNEINTRDQFFYKTEYTTKETFSEAKHFPKNQR